MTKNICVYCSSGNEIDDKYFKIAKELGIKIAQNGFGLVHGGRLLGLMGEVATNAYENGAKVLGIVPEKLYNVPQINFHKDIELIITKDMRERKQKMEENANAFIALPGGYGTLEEISEIIVGKQLGYHYKPIVFLNVDGYFNKLFEFFDTFYTEEFAAGTPDIINHKAESVDDAINYIKNYKITTDKDKWLEKFNFVHQ